MINAVTIFIILLWLIILTPIIVDAIGSIVESFFPEKCEHGVRKQPHGNCHDCGFNLTLTNILMTRYRSDPYFTMEMVYKELRENMK